MASLASRGYFAKSGDARKVGQGPSQPQRLFGDRGNRRGAGAGASELVPLDVALSFLRALERGYVKADESAISDFFQSLCPLEHLQSLFEIHQLFVQSEDPARLIRRILRVWEMESADDPKAKVSTVLPQQHAVLDATFSTRRDGGSSVPCWTSTQEPISCNAGPLTSITAGRAAEESSWKASISVWRTHSSASPSSSGSTGSQSQRGRGYGSLGVLDPFFAYVEGHLEQIKSGPPVWPMPSNWQAGWFRAPNRYKLRDGEWKTKSVEHHEVMTAGEATALWRFEFILAHMRRQLSGQRRLCADGRRVSARR
ncbi:WD repeat-containing protein 75 [Durusdinium trenchii]|uniref:WD repeat-containing protein 75 n=1 Tax=Durusdinium trenchii TaxID=1381693 RepID=A0ABP0IDA0_9DINO